MEIKTYIRDEETAIDNGVYITCEGCPCRNDDQEYIDVEERGELTLKTPAEFVPDRIEIIDR